MFDLDPAALMGWGASTILVLTMSRQVYTQWRDESAEGVSRWLFVGQIVASLGFTAYSVMKHDPVFVFTNGLMVINGVVGLVIDRRNRRRSENKVFSLAQAGSRVLPL